MQGLASKNSALCGSSSTQGAAGSQSVAALCLRRSSPHSSATKTPGQGPFHQRQPFSSSSPAGRRSIAPVRWSSKYGDSLFADKHNELQNHPAWYGVQSLEATGLAPGVVRATRSDVRLVQEFAKYLRQNSMDLKRLFCADPTLSGGLHDAPNPSPAIIEMDMCALPGSGPADGELASQMALLEEYLTSGGGLRVGERLPNWFAAGGLRGGLKVWMALRTSQPKAAQAAAAAAPCDSLPTAAWNPAWAENLAGWEADPSRPATAADVAQLTRLATLVRGRRLDMGALLQEVAGVDPFAWVMAQVAQGTMSEPEPWLLEKWFTASHAVGGPLPMWYTAWGTADKLAGWLAGPTVAAWEEEMRAMAMASDDEDVDTSSGVVPGVVGSTSSAGGDDDVMGGGAGGSGSDSDMVGRLVAAVATARSMDDDLGAMSMGAMGDGRMVAAMAAAASAGTTSGAHSGKVHTQAGPASSGSSSSAGGEEGRCKLLVGQLVAAAQAGLRAQVVTAAPAAASSSDSSVQAPAVLQDVLPGSASSFSMDCVVATRDVALVCHAIRQQDSGVGGGARAAKEVLDYGAWLLQQQRGSRHTEPSQVVRVALWPGPGRPAEAACRYLAAYGVAVLEGQEVTPERVAELARRRAPSASSSAPASSGGSGSSPSGSHQQQRWPWQK